MQYDSYVPGNFRGKEKGNATAWEFLGPAFLVAAYYQKEKENGKKNGGQDLGLWKRPQLMNGPGWVRDEVKLAVETFVLV